jgi:uncharacterized tellurite resistance protein B-like protein
MQNRNWDGRKSKFEISTLGILNSKSKNFDSALMSISAKVAKADGFVCKNEISTVTSLVSKEFNHSSSSKKELFEIFNDSKNSDVLFEKYVQNLHINNKKYPDLIINVLDFLLDLSYSDQKFCPFEEKLINSSVRIFEIEQKVFRSMQKHYHLNLENKLTRSAPNNKPERKAKDFSTVEVFPEEVRKLYALVDSNPADSLETIRLNYQAIAHRARPSQLSINAMPNEKILNAQNKYSLATQAYRQILRDRGQ